jgi:AcrR family transcriptional regulator
MTYELFLDVALELFTQKGYAATTVDNIAQAAGATRTTFYLHFASRLR